MAPPKDIRQRLLATFQIEHRDHVEQIRSLLGLIENTAAGAELDEAFRRAHSLKGAARAVDLRPVEGLAHRLETLFSRVRQGALAFDKSVAGVVSQALDASEDCVVALGDNRPTPGFGSALQALERVLGMEPESPPASEPAAPMPGFQALETVRVTVQNFDGLLRSAGGLLAESQRQNHVMAQLNLLALEIAGMEKEAASARRTYRSAGAGAFLASIESRTRSLARRMHGVRRLHQRSSWTMAHLGKQLQGDVWQARMVPADTLLEGFRKMMRDLARDDAKEIDFRVTNSGVHADRRVLDSLKDPLMHLLRNAVSHGIEPPRDRVAKGKLPAGLVALRVETEGQRLAINIEDDGRGVDFSRVAEVAVRQGILPDIAASSASELGRILFRPGFSTSQTVTDLSGRGMGLSVVQEAVRRLQGDVDIAARDGGGTVLRVSVPLSIATHRLLMIRCGDRVFGVPIHAVARVARTRLDAGRRGYPSLKPAPTKSPRTYVTGLYPTRVTGSSVALAVETVDGKQVLQFDDQTIPLFHLHHLLGLSPPSDGALNVIVLRSRGRLAAVTIDAFLWEKEAVIQDLGPASARDGKISGGVILDDGGIAFVLNVTEIFDAPRQAESPASLPSPAPARREAPLSILVVDDSLTTRTLEKSILEANGYRVQVAVDGMEALAKLRSGNFGLVITDVEMPRLDGFGLLAAMKKDARLARVPVIVVTSLDRREDQKRGLDLGADSYIVKRKFDQEELLAAIRQIR